MSQSITQRSVQLRDKARKKAASEMAMISATNWRGMVTEHRRAIDIVSLAQKYVNQLIDGAVKQVSGHAEVQDAWEAFATTQLDLAESILERNTKAEMRIAQLQGFLPAMVHQRTDLVHRQG